MKRNWGVLGYLVTGSMIVGSHGYANVLTERRRHSTSFQQEDRPPAIRYHHRLFQRRYHRTPISSHTVALKAMPSDLVLMIPRNQHFSTILNAGSVMGGMILLIGYHLQLYLREKRGERSWRSAQADTREKWAMYVRDTQSWLYAIQTLRNAITAQTFLATTVLSLLTVISGRLWEILRTLPVGSHARNAWIAQFLLVASSMVTSAYHFLQSARLMTHAGFMFPIESTTTKVDRIMRRSQNSQWLGLRCLYIAVGLVSWIIGGPSVFLVASLMLTLFFRSIDKVPEALDDNYMYDI